jgi:hypothetical protein
VFESGRPETGGYPLTICVVLSCLVGAFANAPAKADAFDFSFESRAKGTFTTGAAASDPGYQLITGLTFNVLEDTADGDKDFPNMIGQDFAPGAAFNPTTGAFTNHLNGGDVHNIGDFKIVNSGGDSGSVRGASFEMASAVLSASIGGGPFTVFGPLTITRSPAAAVPEASTWAMMLLGFAGLGFVGYQSRRLTHVLNPDASSLNGR